MADEVRKIVAILSSDIVFDEGPDGESLAEANIEAFHEVQRELVEQHDGEWHPEAGHAALATFATPQAAVRCALEIQRAMADEPGVAVRIGIHVGDLVFRTTDEGTGIFGDAVNVAARLHAVTRGSGICISEPIYEEVRRDRGIDFKSLGQKHLKHVNRPIEVYQAADRIRRASEGTLPAPATRRWLLPTVIAVAVLIAALGALLMTDSDAPDGSASDTEVVDLPETAEVVADETADAAGIEDDVVAADEVEAADVLEAELEADEAGVDPSEIVAEDEVAVEIAQEAETAAETPLETPSETTPEAAAPASFADARRALLALDGAGRFDARLWTVPDPVKNEALYTVAFEANCDCTALLFAVDGSADEITLLYPNPYEPARKLAPGVPASIPTSASWQIRAVGGEGIDVLKLVVSSESLTFPADPTEAWAATPADAAQVGELNTLLRSIEQGATNWDAATAPLQIIP